MAMTKPKSSQIVHGNETVAQKLDNAAYKNQQNAFTNTTASTSATTGAITVAGGIGVQGAVHSGATLDWLAANTQVAPMAFIRDMYRQQVEAASGGMQTVLYTAKGQPSIMNVVPAFSLEDIDPSLGTGVHPAFIVGGVQKRELFIGTYQGIVKNGELLSMPGVNPATGFNHDQFVTTARATGHGWHCITNAEWAALGLWCQKNGFMPRGNDDHGRSSYATYEVARRVDGKVPGTANSGNAHALTGSGPTSWRHDNSPNGIADLCGNLHEWATGLRLVDGEIQITPDNDAALNNVDLGRASSAWRAIRASDGALVNPGTVGTLKFDSTVSGTVITGEPVLSNEVTNRNGAPGDDGNGTGRAARAFKTLVTKEGITAPTIVKALGLFPVSDTLGGDALDLRNYGERLSLRGGYWYGNAGIFALDLGSPRTAAYGTVTSRPAFCL